MIKVNNLIKSYGIHPVLKGVSFEVKKGQVYGFLGHNGAGKSTTMNILTGLIGYNGGDITINGSDLGRSKRDVMGTIGYLPEDPRYYSYMSAKEYLSFIADILGYKKSEIQKRTKELLSMVKLEEAAKRRLGGFSRGMKQRLGLAAAIYNRPEILILDEPLSALDPEGRREIIDIIGRFKAEGITIFFSSHILNDVERLCDMVGILDGGKIILEDSLENITNRYALPIYDIEFERPCGGVAEEIQKQDWVDRVSIERNRMSIYANNLTQAKQELIKIIAAADNPVEAYNIRKSSLEDIFMRMVKKSE